MNDANAKPVPPDRPPRHAAVAPIASGSLLSAALVLGAIIGALSDVRAAEFPPVRLVQSRYVWDWTPSDDGFRLSDRSGRLIASARLQPVIVVQPAGASQRLARQGRVVAVHTEPDRLRVSYGGINDVGGLELEVRFAPEAIWLEAPSYHTPREEDVVSVDYFATATSPEPTPSLVTSHLVVPGLCMGAGISPIVPAHSGLDIAASLGTASSQGRGLSQQWGLPSHFFAGFNATGDFNVRDAFTRLRSEAFGCGLAELPSGDVRLGSRGGRSSLRIAYRSDLWRQLRGPGSLRLGARLILTVAPTWPEAIRSYYRQLLQDDLVIPPPPGGRSRRTEIALTPQFNTWGAAVAAGKAWSKFDQVTLEEIYARFRQSGLRAGMFVVDATWEGEYGSLEHCPRRFPDFEAFLDRARSDGHRLGLWAAFLRCENPAVHGLSLDHVFRDADGNPIARHEGAKTYYLFDFTQPVVEARLRERAAAFVRRYQPDLVKFDFGYELPPLDVAAPQDRQMAGERALPRALEIVLGAMREVNPDLAVMYYGLSPFLAGHVDLHSPDDLWQSPGDYDLEANRRFLFSGLLGELGVPTLGSTGYDWVTAPSIWFDAASLGTLGSLQTFAGDELGQFPDPNAIAKYNGLTRLLRASGRFTIVPLDTVPHSAVRGANAGSWARIEAGETVMVALRDRDWAGRPGSGRYLGLIESDASVVVASRTSAAVDRTPWLGAFPTAAASSRYDGRRRKGAPWW